jgi:F420-0:gamma-glutamyl ligase
MCNTGDTLCSYIAVFAAKGVVVYLVQGCFGAPEIDTEVGIDENIVEYPAIVCIPEKHPSKSPAKIAEDIVGYLKIAAAIPCDYAAFSACQLSVGNFKVGAGIDISNITVIALLVKVEFQA